jgi:hypothetical protein
MEMTLPIGRPQRLRRAWPIPKISEFQCQKAHKKGGSKTKTRPFLYNIFLLVDKQLIFFYGEA